MGSILSNKEYLEKIIKGSLYKKEVLNKSPQYCLKFIKKNFKDLLQ